MLCSNKNTSITNFFFLIQVNCHYTERRRIELLHTVVLFISHLVNWFLDMVAERAERSEAWLNRSIYWIKMSLFFYLIGFIS